MQHNMQSTHLIDPLIQQNLENALHQCKEFKIKYYSKWFNIGFLVIGIIIIACWLYYCYTHKQTGESAEAIAYKQRTHLLKTVAERQKRILNETFNKSGDITTGLPDFPTFAGPAIAMPLPTGSSLSQFNI